MGKHYCQLNEQKRISLGILLREGYSKAQVIKRKRIAGVRAQQIIKRLVAVANRRTIKIRK